MNYDKIKRYRKYDIVAIVVLLAILSAIATAIVQLFQLNVNVEKVVEISLQKVIGSSRAIIPCIIAFVGSVITAPKGYLMVIRKLCDLDPYIAALNANNEEQLEYQQCPEIVSFLLDRIVLISIISYSLLIFTGIVIATAFSRYLNITVIDLQSKFQMVFLTMLFSAILNIIKTKLAVTQMPKIMVKNYEEIKHRAKQQSKEILSQ